jgi:hypothetical protein
MSESIADLARRLAHNAEAVCRHYLSNGRRQGRTLIERRNSFEFMRDTSIQLYEMHTGEAWRPRCSSLVSRSTLTAAMIDSSDFLASAPPRRDRGAAPKGIKDSLCGWGRVQ